MLLIYIYTVRADKKGNCANNNVNEIQTILYLMFLETVSQIQFRLKRLHDGQSCALAIRRA